MAEKKQPDRKRLQQQMMDQPQGRYGKNGERLPEPKTSKGKSR